jgi:hypothetical protein
VNANIAVPIAPHLVGRAPILAKIAMHGAGLRATYTVRLASGAELPPVLTNVASIAAELPRILANIPASAWRCLVRFSGFLQRSGIGQRHKCRRSRQGQCDDCVIPSEFHVLSLSRKKTRVERGSCSASSPVFIG